MSNNKASFGTFPVFLTAISTILGAILYLRFGYAVAHTGFYGVILIIILGNLITIPTAMAVAEIATNRKVEGGGAYYIISRSFGLNIGAAIGIALYLSQAISVAFYIIAFSEAFMTFSQYLLEAHPEHFLEYEHILLNKTYVGLGIMSLLTLLMFTKGADIGVKALYYVVFLLFSSLILFFLGEPIEEFQPSELSFFNTVKEPDSFFKVFTIIFPAFTGIAAGLGLSGDLKNPRKAIPQGTLWATGVGIIIYVLVAYKLTISANLEDLGADQLIMSRIALWGDFVPIIAIGLAAAAISSALGSIMVAPRTLQALGVDQIFPSQKINKLFASESKKNNEPLKATLISCIIAFIFISVGNIDFVAEIISMFFMVTYGAICTISFLEHFSGDPSYRPTFQSRWYISLMGAVLSFWLMFMMNFNYALGSLILMALIYLYISKHNTNKGGLIKLFRGVIFQLNRQLQVFVQKKDYNNPNDYWRPFAVCVSDASFKRRDTFDLMRWISQKYGFGTYIHHIKGFLNSDTVLESKETLNSLIKIAEGSKNKTYLDTIISPSYTSAVAQVIQMASISGKGHNLIVFEYPRNEPEKLQDIINNYDLLKATNFDVCILGSSFKSYGYRKEIHIWINSSDIQDSTLEVLMGYILLGHKDWKNAIIKIFALCDIGKAEQEKETLLDNIQTGRLPVSRKNIQLIPREVEISDQELINKYSFHSDLTILGFDEKHIKDEETYFQGYPDLGNILFVNSMNSKALD
ncbi:MAG: hypothetical protein ACPGSD_02660 [Flavobacteriales bacterium]